MTIELRMSLPDRLDRSNLNAKFYLFNKFHIQGCHRIYYEYRLLKISRLLVLTGPECGGPFTWLTCPATLGPL